jgi:hypothetical protein
MVALVPYRFEEKSSFLKAGQTVVMVEEEAMLLLKWTQIFTPFKT